MSSYPLSANEAANRLVHVGKYIVDTSRVLGRGARAVVYLGYNADHRDDFIAVKAISLEKLSVNHLESLKVEIDLLKYLRNNHIVQYIDHEETRDRLYLMMEYMEGGSLAALLKGCGSFSEAKVVHFLSQILDGLKYLHKEGVCHRDIKGANLLTKVVKHDSTETTYLVKLADFGVACRQLEDVRSFDVAGTPYWMAPEVIQLKPASCASDIWSLGCTVIELLTGSPPLFHLLPLQALYRIVQDEFPPIPEQSSVGCRDFLLRCFRRDSLQRPTAVELARDPWILHVSSLRYGHSDCLPTLKNVKIVVGENDTPINEEAVNNVSRLSLSFDAVNKFSQSRTNSLQQNPLSGLTDKQDLNSPSPILRGAMVSSFCSSSLSASSSSPSSFSSFTSSSFVSSSSFSSSSSSSSSSTTASSSSSFSSGNHVVAQSVGFDGDTESSELDVDFDLVLTSGSQRSSAQQMSYNVMDYRSKIKKHSAVVDECLTSLLSEDKEDVAKVVASCCLLIEEFKSHPKTKDHFIRKHGIFCILELLEDCSSPDVALSILQVVNQITADNMAVLESLCYIGTLPIIGQLFTAQHPHAVRSEVCVLLQRLLRCNIVVLDMFVLSNGVRALVELLRLPASINGMVAPQHVFDQCRCCPQTAVEVIHFILCQSLRVSHNHLCVLLVVNHVGGPLSFATLQFLNDKNTSASLAEILIQVWTFLTSCQTLSNSADVRSRLSTPIIVQRLFECLRLLQSKEKVNLLNCIFNLTQSSDLTNICNAGCVTELIKVLDYVYENRMNESDPTEFEHLALKSLFNLTSSRCCRENWEQASNSGIVPHLKRLAEKTAQCANIAIPMLCELVCSCGEDVRRQLWDHDVLEYLLKAVSWPSCFSFQLSILNSLQSWLNVKISSEAVRVATLLSTEPGLGLLTNALRSAQSSPEYVSYLEVFGWFCGCDTVADKFGRSQQFMSVIIDALLRGPSQSGVRLNLLKIIGKVFECSQHPRILLESHPDLGSCAESCAVDSSDLVRENARRLLNAFASVGKMGSLAV